jgi:hypothetical protein
MVECVPDSGNERKGVEVNTLLFMALALLLQQPVLKIFNFDKTLSGTDKIVFIAPPPGKTWEIVLGSAMIEKTYEGVTFMAWLEDGPFAPYRDPVTGEMVGCGRCLTFKHTSAVDHTFFPIVEAQDRPVVISWPTRLGVALTPGHGVGCPPNSCLPEDIRLLVRLRVIEIDAEEVTGL